MESLHQKSHHITRIDALRGLAVLSMMIAHALFFFHNHTIDWLTGAEQFFNTTVLTTFVFVAGLSLSRWLDMYAHEPTRMLARTVWRRVGLLYLVYAVTAIAAVATVVPAPSLMRFGYETLRALTLLYPPNFTEYLPLFILLGAVILPLRSLYRWTRQSLLLTIIAGALSYVVGILLYPLTFPPYINELKQLMAGGYGVMRFPLLFYFPVLLFGLWWQHQADHGEYVKKLRASQNGLLATIALFAAISVIIAKQYTIPLIDPGVRWPPSLAFLAIGLSAVSAAYLALPSFRWTGMVFKSVFVYFGQDAIDLWMNHLIILFAYRKFIGAQSGNIMLVAAETVVVVLGAIAASSVRLTNRIAFPFHIALQGSSRLRRRYAVIVLATIILLLLSADKPKTTTSTSGFAMIESPLTVFLRLPRDTQIFITTDRNWATPRFSKYDSITITLRAVNTAGTSLSLSSQTVTLHVGSLIRTKKADVRADGTLVFALPVSDIPVGEYKLMASVPAQGGEVTSNTVSLSVTEPLLVAWTFDWEGWDVPDNVLSAVDALETPYRRIPLTHFVSARTFLPGALPKERQKILAAYLQSRRTKGDEIGLHMHMYYDLVSAAGIIPKTTRGWGLRTPEGYDIPATEYTSAEFETLLEFSKKLMNNAGLSNTIGFRSGGWFINAPFLGVLKSHGFVYDSSGRDRPKTGAFAAIPWRLNIGSQPYYPGTADQNSTTSNTSGIVEIPNNGVTTYESTLEELITRSKTVYTTGVLTTPKMLVYTSHPQFAGREFATIPHMLAFFDNMSLALNRGPVIYVTVSDIYSLWTSLR